MASWSTRAALRGTDGPPWSTKNTDMLSRMSSRSSTSSTSMDVPPTPPADWLPECQLTAHGDLTVTERLATLLDTGQFADVTIRVGQGAEVTSFKAHRLLLATASQPLYRLVSTVQSGHSDFNTFRVTDVDPSAFKSVLKFIYTDEIIIDSIIEAFSLLKAGKKWNLKKMNDRTIKYLERFLEEYSPSTEEKKNEIFDLLLLADAHSPELFEKCLNTVIKFASDLIPCQGFLRLDERTIRRLIGDKNFVFEDQLRLFEAIRDWGMNQILLKGLGPAQLHPIIEALLAHVDLAQIKDNDFMGTLLPSECLGRAEIIAFFMTRGMEIPRDMGFNNNKQSNSIMQNGEVKDFKKVARFKRGYRLPHKEIYQEHELRFRVDQDIKLLGVGFGFLFSNTDMGVTLHCQGPWERVQWSDMTQTYCRVSWEKMQTADLRLMFTEPARLEAKHCYKVVVKVTRMTAGSTDVELWGGKDGVPFVEAEDAKFYFIKAAVDPKNEVDIRETDTKQGMITELLYVIDDSPPPKVEEITRRRRPLVVVDDPPPVEPSVTYTRKRPSFNISEDRTDTIFARRRPVGGSYNRWQPAMSAAPEPATNKWATKEKSPTTPVQETPGFLRSRATAPAPSESPFGERLPPASSRAVPSWSRSRATANETSAPSNTSTTTNRYGRDTTTSSIPTSRYGRESSDSRDTTGTSSTTSTSRYGKDSSASRSSATRDTGSSGSSLYRRDSTTSSSGLSSYRRDSIKDSSSTPTTTSLNRSDSSASRYGRERDSSASRYSSRFGGDSSTSRFGTTGSTGYGSGYGSSRFISSYTSRYR